MKARDKNLRLVAIIKCCLSGSKKYTEERKKKGMGEEGSGEKRKERERSSRMEEKHDFSSENEPCLLTDDDQSQQ